jgi:hypothetical protein
MRVGTACGLETAAGQTRSPGPDGPYFGSRFLMQIAITNRRACRLTLPRSKPTLNSLARLFLAFPQGASPLTLPGLLRRICAGGHCERRAAFANEVFIGRPARDIFRFA